LEVEIDEGKAVAERIFDALRSSTLTGIVHPLHSAASALSSGPHLARSVRDVRA